MTTTNVKVYKDLMGENEKWANETRRLLTEKCVLMINLIGSPGSGKTALLERMAKSLENRIRFAVLEGDVETTRDAERIAAVNIQASQLLTGGACHLEAKLVHYALKDLPLDDLDMVVVENVGNLVCPAEFDVGEMAKIAVLSVAEGDDKPSKYPLLFHEAKAVILTKIDLLLHVDFDVDDCIANIKRINASAPVFTLSAKTGIGVDNWINWLHERR
ncbi:MAG: hydrogenase nickel incorporation protein HypB [Lentisphaerales bacterium]|jgi:hydrogenase nickel incorporation protein HypB|nr:MAG: hydrogenase nickel incorporation protein HypB [Lentisphaerales bacterium]